MKYMLLIYSAEGSGPDQGTPEFGEVMAGYFRLNDTLQEAGALVSGEPLQPVSTATTVQVRDGDRIVTDGPFAETKEQLGGYYLVEADDLDQALEWAAMIPTVTHGSIEVRPLMEIPSPPPG